MDKLVQETVADGRWFPLRFKADRFQFAFIPPERHRETAFLVYLQPPADQMRSIARSALSGAQLDRTDLHFILHLGFGGSTLLGKILAQPGVALALQEPPVLTDIVAYGVTTNRAEKGDVLLEATKLLSPEDCRGGTEFYRHLPTGTDHAPFTREGLLGWGYSSYKELNQGLLDRDGLDRSKWELTMTVPMRFNRLVLQQPQYWHTAGPSFGDSVENGRLVYLMRFFLSGTPANGVEDQS